MASPLNQSFIDKTLLFPDTMFVNRAYFRFYAQLNDFLPIKRRKVNFVHCFKNSASIKDTIEALGVPHTEVDLILANGKSVNFSYLIQDSDRFSVYPFFKSIDITPLLRVRLPSLPFPRFVLDVHLGKLTRDLRLLGFDSLYRNDYCDRELARSSSSQRRILLTRDRNLLKRSMITYGYFVRATNPWQQLLEVLRRFDLFGQIDPWQRCLHCNGLIFPVSKALVSDRLPPKTKQYYDEFRLCSQCDRIYWKGSHYEHMLQFIKQIIRINSED